MLWNLGHGIEKLSRSCLTHPLALGSSRPITALGSEDSSSFIGKATSISHPEQNGVMTP